MKDDKTANMTSAERTAEHAKERRRKQRCLRWISEDIMPTKTRDRIREMDRLIGDANTMIITINQEENRQLLNDPEKLAKHIISKSAIYKDVICVYGDISDDYIEKVIEILENERIFEGSSCEIECSLARMLYCSNNLGRSCFALQT